MGTIIGALLGAAAIILTGRTWKGRDFLGLGLTMFFFALIIGALLSPAMFVAEYQVAADQVAQGASAEEAATVTGPAMTVTAAIVVFLVAYVPGFFFVALASPAAKAKD